MPDGSARHRPGSVCRNVLQQSLSLNARVVRAIVSKRSLSADSSVETARGHLAALGRFVPRPPRNTGNYRGVIAAACARQTAFMPMVACAMAADW